MDIVEKFVIIIFVALMVPFTASLYFVLEKSQELSNFTASMSSNSLINIISKSIDKIENKNQDEQNINKLQNPPKIIRAIYLTSWSVRSKKYVNEYLENIFKNTEINSVVIDVKDYTGNITYNLENLIEKLHQKNIYTIARISVFQDQKFAESRPDLVIFDKAKTTQEKTVLWRDNNKLIWLDPSSIEAQDYNIAVAENALKAGFDEINFDYIRFPSDGDLKNMGFPHWDLKTPRHIVLKDFFKRIREKFPNDKLSVDLFGQTTTNYDDIGIGQILEDSFEYFDYVCPMIYPSHYAPDSFGFKNPSLYPYDIVKYSVENAIIRRINYNKILEVSGLLEVKLAEIRPWLQDFNMGAIYTTEMVKEQIVAVKEALGENYTGYLIWNPSNVYKTGAFVKEIVK